MHIVASDSPFSSSKCCLLVDRSYSNENPTVILKCVFRAIEFFVAKYRCGVVVIWFHITETGMRLNYLSMYTSTSPRQVLA